MTRTRARTSEEEYDEDARTFAVEAQEAAEEDEEEDDEDSDGAVDAFVAGFKSGRKFAKLKGRERGDQRGKKRGNFADCGKPGHWKGDPEWDTTPMLLVAALMTFLASAVSLLEPNQLSPQEVSPELQTLIL